MKTIEFNSVSFQYNNRIIIKDTSVSIEPEKFTIVVGPNGAGKTTMLRLMSGLLEPVTGTVTIDELPVEVAQRTGLIHLVPQLYNKNAAQFPATVEEIVSIGLAVGAGCPKSERKTRVREALEAVQMTEYSRCRIGDLSGGQQQRVMIAQALARRPKYLLLDEPTSGIDFQSSEHIFKVLKGLCDIGITVVMVTHDVREATRFADRVLCIDNHICYDGDSRGFLAAHEDTPLSWHIGG